VTGGRCRFYYVQGGKSHLETGRSGGLREEKPRQHVFGAMEPHADICVHSTRRQEGTGGNVLPVVLAAPVPMPGMVHYLRSAGLVTKKKGCRPGYERMFFSRKKRMDALLPTCPPVRCRG
jgi:hypothetical protein